MASFDADYFQSLEAVAAPFGLALVSCDAPRAAVGTLPGGGSILFIPRSFNEQEVRQLVAGQILLLPEREGAA